MSFLSVFPSIVAVIDLLAAIAYARDGQYVLASVWFCYAIAAFLLGMVQER